MEKGSYEYKMDTAEKVKRPVLSDAEWENRFKKYVDVEYYTRDRMTFGGLNSTSLDRVSKTSAFILPIKRKSRAITTRDRIAANNTTDRIRRNQSHIRGSRKIKADISN
jgi:hypothetical protein